MAQNIKQDFFKSFSDELLGKLNRISYLTTKAAGEIGNYHEEILKVSLKNFLSKRYSVKTGYIYFDPDHVSKQIDIMIIDENNPFTYLFQSGDFAIVRPNAVVCAIEVKTNLNQKEFVKAFINISEAKRIKYMSKTGGLMGLIFGFLSPITSNNNLDRWFKLPEICNYKNEPELWPNQILFQKHGQLLWSCNGKNAEGKDIGRYFYRIFQDKKDDDVTSDRAFHLSVFISEILAACSLNEINASGRMIGFNSEEIVDFSKFMISYDRFKPDDGYSHSELKIF